MKKLFSFIMVALMSIMTLNAETTRIYCKMAQNWWKVDNAAVGCHSWGTPGPGTSWPGVRMTPVENETDMWYIDLDVTKVQNVIFTRVNPSGNIADWGAKTKDLTIPTNGDNLFTITTSTESWGAPGCDGEWSVYGGAVEKPKHDYTITAYLPEFCDAIAAYADSVRVMGGFDNWTNGIWMEKKIDEDFNDYWYAEIKDVEESTAFKLRFGMDADWKVQVQLNGANMANEAFGETTDIVLHYDGEGYGFAACAAPVARKEFVFVAGEAADSDPAMFAITWGKDGSSETVKMTQKGEEALYTANILETVDSVVLVRCASDATKPIWEGEGSNVWNQTANYELCDTMYFESWVEETNLFAVTCEAPKPVETKYYAKNNWNGAAAEDWSWLEMTKEEDLYVLDSVVFGGTGVNINTKEDDTDAIWFDLKKMKYNEQDTIQALDTVRFELAISEKDTVLTAILLGRPAPAARKEFVFVAGEAAEANPALFAITWGKDGSNETVKMTQKGEEALYTANILETVDSVVLVRCASDATKPIWEGEGTNVWNQTANYELCDTMYFESWVEETNLFAVTCEAPKPVETKYYAKNNWNGAAADDWSWLEMSATDKENIYMLDSVVFGGTGVNINDKEDDTDAIWFAADKIVVLDGLDGLPAPIPPAPQKRDTIPYAPARMVAPLEAPTLLAGDTIKLFFNAADSTLSAAIVGRPEQPEPAKTFDLTIVQDTLWSKDGAKVAAWIWADDLEGQWTEWATNNNDTLTLKVNEKADSIIFIRNANDATEPNWDAWNRIDAGEINECHIYYILDWNAGAWCERPQPVGEKYYITGNAALVGEEKAWKADAIEMTDGAYTFTALPAGEYEMKITNGAWDPEGQSWGSAALSEECSAGVGDKDGNIHFIVETPNDVNVAIAEGKVTVTGTFKQEEPAKTFDLTIVQDTLWSKDGAKVAAWIWADDLGGQWTEWATNTNDTLTLKVDERADSIILVRNASEATEPTWDAWNRIDAGEINECHIYYILDWNAGAWCERPQPVGEKYYITGNAALVGEEKAWKADAIEMTDGAYTFTALPAGEYEMKITNGAWEPEGQSWGSAALSEECSAGVGDKDGNIHFIVETPNDVNVAIAEGKVTVTGTFKQEPVEEGFGILVNGTTYEKGEASDIDGGKEYKVVLDLNIGDFVQLYDGAKHVAWVVDPEGSGYTNFDQHDNALYIKENGNYQFYVKIFTDATSGLYVGFTSDPTGLIEIMRNAKDGKFIINGNMIIRRNGALYTIQGARL